LTEPAAPLGLYVHWPYCARICPYCDFNVVRDRGRRMEAAALADAICADLACQAAHVGPRRLDSIFLGGGTPSLMAPEAVERIIAAARAAFEPAADLEVTLEANPTDAETARFAALAAAGVNRLSLGVQSLEDEALVFLGRNHDAATARRAAATASRVFARLSIDLIYARPGQTPACWRDELNRALDLGAEHVSAYQLTVEPGVAFERQVRRGLWAPPDPETARALYETTSEVLGAAGLDLYEVSNHARSAAARSRHNLIYWRGGDYLGVGPGAHGRITDPGGMRWASLAPATIAGYVARVAETGCGVDSLEPLSAREAALECLLMGLRTCEGVARAAIAALDIDPARLEPLVAAGLLEASTERLVARAEGRLVLDRLVLELAEAARAR